MPAPEIQIEYNQELKALEEVLARVQRPGDFFANGSLVAPMPRLDIEGVGTISFPVPDSQVREIMRHAEQAPYGRGEETIVDTTVRKVWQVAPGKVRLGGTGWSQTFETILARVVQALGCQHAAVSAELYKLLIYDVGAFFVSHRDTEKAKGMFGTLVVVLPSFHTGGELIVRHAGREVFLDLRTEEVSQLRYAAFYADCEHEVRPITGGNRVCLIYNLIQVPSAKGSTEPLVAPLYETEIVAAAKILSDWAHSPDARPKLAYLLEHQYSPEGLSFSGLKNADAALAKVLSEAGRRSGFAVHVGIVNIEESGSAEVPYEPSYRRSRWSRDYDDEPAAPSNSQDFEIIDVCDRTSYINNWLDPEDRPIDFGKLPLEEGELLPQGALDEEPPDEQRVTEATGNEGASFERSYHRAALVLWSEERYPEVLLQGGVGAVLPYLRDLTKQSSSRANSPGNTNFHERALKVATLVVTAWEDSAVPAYPFQSSDTPPDRAEMLRLLEKLADSQLVERFMGGVIAQHYDGSENGAIIETSSFLGAERTGKLLAKLVEQNMPLFHGSCVQLLDGLIDAHEEASTPDWLTAHRQIATAAVRALKHAAAPAEPNSSMDWRRREQAKPIDAMMVSGLFKALRQLGSASLAEQAAALLAADPLTFVPDVVIIPALSLLDHKDSALAPSDPATILLWEHAAGHLLARAEHPPVPPTDWAQPVKIDCRCEECRQLEKFTADPVAQIHRFRVRKDRRQHLHSMIERYALDMKHETEPFGSPQTLVCTKTRQRFEKLRQHYSSDLKSLRVLSGLVRGTPPPEIMALQKRISAAIGRAGKA